MNIIIGLLLAYLFIKMLTPEKTIINSSSCAKGHKWIYKDEGTEHEYLICSVCNKMPSQIISDVGSEI